eukprot:jgi/Bigna1/76035/fgenesh1_pg.38_\
MGFLYTGYCAWVTAQAPNQVAKGNEGDKSMPMSAEANGANVNEINMRLIKYSCLIQNGAMGFLKYEYICIAIFAVLFAGLAGSALAYLTSAERAVLTMFAYLLGTGTSMLAGWVGMAIAVFANSRVALKCYSTLASGLHLEHSGP